jgi:putative mRNA 3-end processing factor
MNIQIQPIFRKNENELITIVRSSKFGIIVEIDGKTVSLDPKRFNHHSDFTFISHAHTDHLCKKTSTTENNRKILVSKATSLIAQARGYRLNDVTEVCDGFQLINTGHILGSRGLLIGNELYYTGDISIRERSFMKPADIPSAHTLIIESTFGRPEYVFPSLVEVIHKTNGIISEMYNLGIPVLLMGYPVGKAQLLAALFGHWDPIFVHDSIDKMNSVYMELGINLKDMTTHSVAEKKGLLAKNKPWLMIAPLNAARSNFVKLMKKRYGAVTIGFSGWAIDRRYKFMMDLDYTMPMSDHCDFPELVKVVRACNPKKIYTFHGFSDEFAASLRKIGFDAESLVGTNGQKGQRQQQPAKKQVPSSMPDEYTLRLDHFFS